MKIGIMRTAHRVPARLLELPVDIATLRTASRKDRTGAVSKRREEMLCIVEGCYCRQKPQPKPICAGGVIWSTGGPQGGTVEVGLCTVPLDYQCTIIQSKCPLNLTLCTSCYQNIMQVVTHFNHKRPTPAFKCLCNANPPEMTDESCLLADE